MPNMLILGRGGAINAERVLAVVHAKSAPVLRLVQATDPSHILNMTYGYPRRSVIVLDNGLVVLSSRTPTELTRALGLREELPADEDQPPWW